MISRRTIDYADNFDGYPAYWPTKAALVFAATLRLSVALFRFLSVGLTASLRADMTDFEATKRSEPAVVTTVAGHKAYSTKVTTGIGSVGYTIFTTDGRTYFAMFSMNGGAAPFIALIKAAE